MRILIVNAHAPNAESQRSFQDLLASIKEILRIRNGLLEMKDEYVIRSKDNIEDFLYDEYTSFSLVNAGKQFDALDFIVVSGDLHLLPWHQSNFKVVTLIRMCLRVKKCLFAIGFAMQALVYLSASNIDHPIHIINGNGKGSNLSEMSQLTLKPAQIKNEDYFLDSVTGDLYAFQHENNEWQPVCNVGLHHSRAAQQFLTIGKFIIKTPVYRPKKNAKAREMLDEYIETKCYVKKVYLKHWLLQNCNIDFTVPYNGRWEVHSFSFTNKEKSFDVLAESENGPLIIDMHRIVGVKFLINKKYKETFQVFSNYIMKYASDIMSSGKSQDMSILNYVDISKAHSKQIKFNPKAHDVIPDGARISTRANQPAQKYSLANRSSTATGQRITTESENEDGSVFKHSGFASKNKGKHIMNHNFISSGKIHYDLKEETPKRKKTQFLSPDEVLGKYTTQSKTSGEFEYHPDTFDAVPGRPILKGPNSSLHRLQRALGGKSVSISGTNPSQIYNRNYMRQLKSITDDDFTLSRGEAKRMLYPELPIDSEKHMRKIWIPGNMSTTLTKSPEFGSPKPIRVNTTELAYRKKGPLQKLDFQEVEKKTIRSEGPYKTNEQLYKDYQKEKDLKIIGPKLFKTSMDYSISSKTLPTSPAEMGYKYFVGNMGIDRLHGF